MKCPFCKKQLKKGEFRRYETLLDHVSNPNSETPLRPTLICDCEKGRVGFWDLFGDNYIHSGVFPALGSMAHKLDRQNKLSNWILPLLWWSKYPYDTTYRITKFFIR